MNNMPAHNANMAVATAMRHRPAGARAQDDDDDAAAALAKFNLPMSFGEYPLMSHAEAGQRKSGLSEGARR